MLNLQTTSQLDTNKMTQQKKDMEDMADPMNDLQELLEKLEAVAEEVLCDRHEIISLDRRRNANREALRALKNSTKAEECRKSLAKTKVPAAKKDADTGVVKSIPMLHTSEYSSNTWTCIGDMFLRMPKPVLMESINQEQKQLDNAIKDLRNGLKNKVNTIRELEGDEPSRGTALNSLSKEEWAGIKQVIKDKY